MVYQIRNGRVTTALLIMLLLLLLLRVIVLARGRVLMLLLLVQLLMLLLEHDETVLLLLVSGLGLMQAAGEWAARGLEEAIAGEDARVGVRGSRVVVLLL